MSREGDWGGKRARCSQEVTADKEVWRMRQKFHLSSEHMHGGNDTVTQRIWCQQLGLLVSEGK